MKRLFILSIALSFCLSSAFAQLPGPHYRQFFFNPFLFNPAFVAINNNLEANVAYRQQWTNFKDAPVTMGANLQFPASNRVAIGFSVFTDKQVLLRNSNFMATFGYVVPIAEKQSLRFALSGGVGLNKLDLTADELNTNDPAILNATGNNWYVDGNFGMVYTNGGLRLGFALTDLFKSNTFNSENFNSFEFSNLKNRLFSASYRFNISPTSNASLEPYFLYKQTEDGQQDSWEAATVAYFKDSFWTGLSYNQYSGAAVFLGLNVKEKFRFSYSYEFPPSRIGVTSGSSHELHIGIKLKSKKTLTTVKKKPSYHKVLANARVRQSTPAENKPSDIPASDTNEPAVTMSRNTNREDVVDPTVKTDVTEKSITIETPKAPPSKTMESFTMTAGHHYVVVGVFKVLNHSMKFSKDMISQGHQVNVALNPKNNMYYVYVSSTTDVEEAKRMRSEFKRKNLLKEAWIFTAGN